MMTSAAFPQISANTPDSVFQFLEFIKELLLFVHQNYILPALHYIFAALQHLWQSLQDSCNGEVSLLCMQKHVVAFTNSTWIYLQDKTTAFGSWAQELLSKA